MSDCVMSVSRQKQKLLFLRELMLTKTDESNPLTGKEIIDILAKNGIREERKTLYDDIAALSESGLIIEVTKKGHQNAYYVAERTFTDEELYVLADAVASSRFLTVKKSSELIEKLKTLTSQQKGKALKRQVFVESRVKTYNEGIFYTINQINQAIFDKKTIEFKYYTFGADRQKHYRHDGEIYRASPYYLVWKNDCYYLICYSEKHQKVIYLRVDRMTSVSVTDKKRRALPLEEQELAKELRTSFDMYSGTLARVTLEADNSLTDVVIDRFGDKTVLRKSTDSRFAVNVDVQISPTFWGWLFTFGDKMKITSPDWVVNSAKEYLDSITKLYK